MKEKQPHSSDRVHHDKCDSGIQCIDYSQEKSPRMGSTPRLDRLTERQP
jgi:hypothetical protein